MFLLYHDVKKAEMACILFRDTCYCVHEYESDVRVFADVEEILAYELQVHRPIRIERHR